MKNKRLLIMPALLFGAMVVTSCDVTRDPNKAFMQKAKEYYMQLREQEGIKGDAEYKAWYFDPTTLKAALFDSPKSSKYLGLLNVQNLTFSEVEKTHFLDIPNYEVKIDLNTMEFELPPELNLDNPVEFVKKFPFVLIDDNKDISEAVYNKIDVADDGKVSLSNSARATNYDPTLYFINNFAYDIKVDDSVLYSLDYSDCALTFMKRDIIGLFETMLAESEESKPETEVKTAEGNKMPLPFDIIKSFLKSYKKANDLESIDIKAPATLNIPGYFGTNEDGSPRPVAVGPMSFDALLETDSLSDVTSIKLNEGVKKIAFYAFDGAKITDIELPSTIESIDFSSFSNLPNLKTLYVADTPKPIEFFATNGATVEFEFNKAEGEDPIKIQIGEPFGNTTIENIIFENYSNPNINGINLGLFKKPEGKTDADCVKFVSTSGIETYDSLSDAFNKDKAKAINTAYQIKDGLDTITNKDLPKLDKDQTLYLAHSKGNALGQLIKNFDDYHETIYVDESSTIQKAKVMTLKLEQDLEINGNLIVGGVTGREKVKSSKEFKEGAVVGKYSEIDLNGHKIVVNGGYLDVNGRIVDSSTTKSGSIEVKNEGIFKTNLVIEDSYNYSNYVNKFNKGDFPYHFYEFLDCEVPFSISSDSRLYAKETVTRNEQEVGVHTFLFAGKNPITLDNKKALNHQNSVDIKLPDNYESIIKDLREPKEILNVPFIEFKNTSSKLEVSRTNKTKFSLGGEIEINPLTLAYKNAVNENLNKELIGRMFMPLTSKVLDVILLENSKVTANVNVKLLNDSTLEVKSGAVLNLKKQFVTYEEYTHEDKGILSPDFGKEPAKFILKGKLNNVSGGSLNFGGRIYSTLSNVIDFVNSSDVKPGSTSPEGGNNTKGEYNVATFHSNLIFVYDDSNKMTYFRGNEGFYYEYSDGTMLKSTSNTTLATKKANENGGNWIIKDGSKDVNTTLNTDTLTSYTTWASDGTLTGSYLLDETKGSWIVNNTNYDASKHAYVSGSGADTSYSIKFGNDLLQGVFTKNSTPEKLIFQASTSSSTSLGQRFYFSTLNGENVWKKAHFFEHDDIIAYPKEGVNPTVNFDIKNYDAIDLFDNDAASLNKISRHEPSKFKYDATHHIISVSNPHDSAKWINMIDTKEGLVEVTISSPSRYIFKDNLNNKYIFAANRDKIESAYFEKIISADFKDTDAICKVKSGLFAYTSNKTWQPGYEYQIDDYSGFKFFQIIDEGDINRNFALLRSKGEGEEAIYSYDVFTKASGVTINKTDLDDAIKDLIPDEKTYVGYRYIILDGAKQVFVQYEKDQPLDENEPRITKLMKIDPTTTFKEKSEFIKGEDTTIDLKEAFQLMVFNNESIPYYMDLGQTIACGSGSDKEIESGMYLALAVYTDKNIIQESLGLPGTGDLPLPPGPVDPNIPPFIPGI